MRSDDDVVDALRRAHRLAADQADERPDASVRDAVLAAAARAVDAKPRTTATATDGPVATRRWPLPAAAVLAVSAMTALIASQALRDEPERITAIASSPARPERQAAAPAAPVVSEGPAAVAPLDEPRAARHVEAGRASKVAPRPTGNREATGRPPVEHEAASRPTTPRPSNETAADRASSAPAADRASTDAVAARADIASSTMPAPAPPAFRRRVGRAAEPGGPEAWVERIVRLRTEGQDAEADRELEGLRRRYPGFEVPADALRAPADR